MLNRPPSLTQHSDLKIFLFYIGMILTMFTVAGIVQEYIYSHGFKYGFFQAFVIASIYSFISGVRLGKRRVHKYWVRTKQNWHFLKWYAVAALLMVTSLGLGNQVLLYVTYPTKIMAKSCKMFATMIVGVLVLKRKYILMEYISCALLVIGIISLYLGNSILDLQYTAYGLMLILFALFCDAFLGNIQEYLLKDQNESPAGYMFVVNVIGSVFLLLFCAAIGQLKAITFLIAHPMTLFWLISYACCHFFGSLYIHHITKKYGILTSLTTATGRKALTIILSFIIFPKPITMYHIISIILVFAGIILYSIAKIKKSSNKLQTVVHGSSPTVGDLTLLTENEPSPSPSAIIPLAISPHSHSSHNTFNTHHTHNTFNIHNNTPVMNTHNQTQYSEVSSTNQWNGNNNTIQKNSKIMAAAPDPKFGNLIYPQGDAEPLNRHPEPSI